MPKSKCQHENNITYQNLIQIDGTPQYEVKCRDCGKLGVIYLIEGEEDWNCRKPVEVFKPGKFYVVEHATIGQFETEQEAQKNANRLIAENPENDYVVVKSL